MEHPTGYKQIGAQRYRETIGFVFEDFVIGDVFEHRPGRTLTDADNVIMNLLCMNPSPLHIDAAYCAQMPWERPLVSSIVTFGIVCGMSVRSTSGRAVANLGWDRIRLTAPVFVGDTIYAESETLAKRLSERRPGEGIVTCRTRGIKAAGEEFLSFERSFLVPTAERAIEDRVGY